MILTDQQRMSKEIFLKQFSLRVGSVTVLHSSVKAFERSSVSAQSPMHLLRSVEFPSKSRPRRNRSFRDVRCSLLLQLTGMTNFRNDGYFVLENSAGPAIGVIGPEVACLTVCSQIE